MATPMDDKPPTYHARCTHLPDRTIAVHLDEDGALLGVLPGVRNSYPVVKDWVADHLGLTRDSFRLRFYVPRPPYVRDGGRVSFDRDDVQVTGRVSGWADSSVLVSADAPGQTHSGLIPPEELVFPEES